MVEHAAAKNDPRFYRPGVPADEDVRLRIPLAVYREPENSDEIGNPFLLALERPIESTTTLRERLTRTVAVAEADRDGSRLRRKQILLRLTRFVHPLGSSRACYEHIAVSIFEGYATRNPLLRPPEEEDPATDTRKAPSTGLGFAVIGRSGVGKSTAVEAALSLIPPAIEHVRFGGRSFSRYQIPYLKITCGSNAKEFCEDLLKAVDHQIASTYHADLCAGLITRHALVGHLVKILKIHGVGLICIDDIQNLFIGRSSDQAQIIASLVLIVNTSKIPLVVLGTEEALPLFDIRFDTARRLSGLETIVMRPLEDGPEWIGLCERLWAMRVLRVDGPMPEDFAERLLELSRGITDFAVKLVLFAQHRSLAFGEERLDADLLTEVYEIAILLVRDKLKHLGDDPFENYGEAHMAALDAIRNGGLMAALTKVRKISEKARRAARLQPAPAPEPTASAPREDGHAPAAPVGKAKRSGKGGVACDLAAAARKESKSAHAALCEGGLIWRFGEAAAAA